MMYEKLLNDFLAVTDFRLIKYGDGFGLIDLQGGNFGDIEHDRFRNAGELLERMDVYIEDYIVEDLEDEFEIEEYGSWEDLLDIARKKDDGSHRWEIDVFDMILNHFEEVNLEKCCYEEG